MVKKVKIIVLICSVFLLIMCKQKSEEKVNEETILKGSMVLAVDETITPIIEDQVAVFESTYNDAKIEIQSKPEGEIINDLINLKSKVAILARDLTEQEKELFLKLTISPRITPIATDAIALISNKMDKDTLIDLKTVIDFINGKKTSRFKGLVFDNPNSSTARFIKDLAGVKNLPEEGVYSFKTNNEVIKFVAENDGMVGVVGVNWLSQPAPKMQPIVSNVNVLSVKGIDATKYFSPTQNDIAEQNYTLARELYVVNCQGYTGLGMGLASFIAGDIGQRIILKSGLLPYKVPSRKLQIRKQILKDTQNN